MGYVLNKYETTTTNPDVELVQALAGTDFNTSSSTGSISLDNTTVGNMLMVIVQNRAVTNSATAGWTKAQTISMPGYSASDTSSMQYWNIYYKFSEGGTEQFTINLSSSVRLGLVMFEFAGATKINVENSYVFKNNSNQVFTLPESLPSIICAGSYYWSGTSNFVVSGTIPTQLVSVARQYIGYTTSAPVGAETLITSPQSTSDWCAAIQLVIT